MTSDDPWMAWDDLENTVKNWPEKVTLPTKFQIHTKVYANMTSDNPWMTSDDLENTIREHLAWNGP